VIDEQASHAQGMGLSLEELRAQRTELLPERLEMARRRRRRRRRAITGVICHGIEYPDPDDPCNNPIPVRFKG
jgi:hypothetical protein